jgi:cholesterol oxidase
VLPASRVIETDVAVVGSGFGGSVAALRLSEKGYRVHVLEAGARFADADFAATSWHLRRFLFAPRLGCYGIQRIEMLDDCLVLAGAGVGGGSLVYANTLYEAPDEFYADPAWAELADWKAELAPHVATASRMLGVVPYDRMTPADEVMRDVAERQGVGETFRLAPVGVFLGMPGVTVPDPYFGGAGPARTGCTHCGECMTGCRHGAKNTLVKNYLYFAEKAGAVVHPLTTVTAVRPLADGRYGVLTRPTDRRSGGRAIIRAQHVVFAAGALGTQRLLHRLKADGSLPRLSDRLGELTRTNSESLLGATTTRVRTDYTEGVAITSSWHPDPTTHVEPVRYGRGSNAMGLLQTVLVPGGPGGLGKYLRELVVQWRTTLRLASVRRWSERTVIALVMQSRDNSLTVRPGRGRLGRFRLVSHQGHGEPNPTWIPAGHRAVRAMAERMATPGNRAFAGGAIGEPFRKPMTAHILGGCTMGATAETGVIDTSHAVHGYPGLWVMDGAAVSANLGVNPSLTITALAERACSLWPEKA